jgi:DNA-directed RNA polymerase subunit M/transcription elongation factor TFIIS
MSPYKKVSSEALEIDRQVAAESTCDKCNHKGMQFRQGASKTTYIAIARCPKCGYEVEF